MNTLPAIVAASFGVATRTVTMAGPTLGDPPTPAATSSGVVARTVAMAGLLAHSHHTVNVLLAAKSWSDNRSSAHPLHEL
ncbi:unnamed protein product [Sphagnum troendelagicum]|uniref:NADH dehydrogenase subunit 6 n=1 Tax=Sphagnum troendelagicum TaxID=128251 RepID=A0ABP0TQ09_9BRYO